MEKILLRKRVTPKLKAVQKTYQYMMLHLYYRYPYLFFISLNLLFSGCLHSVDQSSIHYDLKKSNPEYRYEKQIRSEIAELRDELEGFKTTLDEQEKLTEELRTILEDKHSIIQQLQFQNERLVNEFICNSPKQHASTNKAEAVRLIAEITAIINTRLSGNDDLNENETFVEARYYLSESEKKIREHDFNGGLYFARLAQTTLKSIKLTPKPKFREVLFDGLISMEVHYKCNVRKEPSMKGRILHVYEKGRKVNGLGYNGKWIMIRVADGGIGWIHCSILNCAHVEQQNQLLSLGKFLSK